MYKRLIAILILSAVFYLGNQAQQTGIMQQLHEEEQSAIEAIALYPERERATILLAASHPEILVRMEHIRRNTEAEFQALIADLSEEDQRVIYNLIRYPDLLNAICDREEKRSRSEMDDLLQDFPEEIREDASFAHRKYFDLLKEISWLYQDSDQAFENVLENYPQEVKEAYRELARLPEIVSILNENMQMTVLLGDIYKTNPETLMAELDSLNVVVAEEKAAELNEWKKELEENPEAMYEYEQAAKEFASEQGYDDEPYSGPIPDRYRQDVYVHHIWRPYPYWFGWPSWYSYEIWYPYPWWYHWGYYYGPSNVIVIVGLPSNFFINWHFRQYSHFYYYPHFTNRIIDHYYYGPRRSDSSIRTVVRNWEREHRDELPEGWFMDDGNRVERIREYGKFKIDHREAIRTTTDKAPTTREFLKENADRYPTLKPVLKETPEPVRVQPRKEPAFESDRRPEPERYEPREKVIEKEKTPRQEEIDRAKERHENIWQRIRKEPARVTPPPQTVPSRREPASKDRQAVPQRTAPVKKDQPSKKTVPRTKDDGRN